MGWSLSARNLLAIAAAPFTAGTSLLLAQDDNGSGIIDHITGEASAKAANEENKRLQQETNQKSIELANTAHQREVADLKAAGLNPVLSAGGSGATTPTLGTAQVQNTMPGGYLAQAQSAGQVASLFSQAKNLNAQSKAIPSQVQLNKTQAGLNQANAQLAKDQDEYYQKTGEFPGTTVSETTGGKVLGIGYTKTKTQGANSARNAKTKQEKEWKEKTKQPKLW